MARMLDAIVPRSLVARDLQPNWGRNVQRSLILSVATVSIIGALSGAPNARERWQTWRSRVLAEDAERSYQEGDVSGSLARANDAYLKSPGNEDAIRWLALKCEEVGSPRALYFFDLLDRLGTLTPEETTTRISALIAANQLKEAQNRAAELLESGYVSARLVELGCALIHSDSKPRLLSP